MNRRRSRIRANFPRNLYENKGYFSWRNPATGEYFGLGTDRARAFEEALEANLKLAKPRERLVDRITGDRKRSVLAWEEKYRAIIAKRGLTKGTTASYLSFSRRMVKMLGENTAMKAVTALQVSEAIDALPRGIAVAVRPYMKNSFETAIAHGWVETNPVRITVLGRPAVVRSRLTLDVLLRIYESAGTWLQNAIALALVSAQRREDVARAEFKDFKDGGWWLTQASEKTDHPHRIFIPNELKPAGFHLSLGQVVYQCRRSGVLASYLVHQTELRRGRSAPGRAIRLSTVSSVFTANVQALGIDWGDKTPPTFHEIRSLSLRLYGDQGVNVQLLAGHSNPNTTSIYLNNRGQDYAKVTV